MRYIIVLMLVFFIPSITYAAINPIDEVDKNYDRLEQERQEQERIRKLNILEQKPKEIEIQEEKDLQPHRGVVITHCFVLEKIVIEDADELSKKKKEEISKSHYHSCLNSEEINKIVTEITNWYVEKGFITTRVYVPEQNIESGTLVLKVIEGRVERVIQNLDHTIDRMEVYTAFPISKGKKLNIRDVEQGLDQLNKLPSNDAQTKILPGAKVGESIIQVTNTQHDSLRAYVEGSNSLNSNGDPKLNLRVEKDNIFYLSDQIQYNYGTGLIKTNEEINKNHNLSYFIPFGYWTVKPGYSYFRSLTNLDVSGTKYPYESKTQAYNINADYVLSRWRASILTLETGVVYKDKKTSFSSQILDTLSRRTSNVELGLDFTDKYSSGFYDVRFTVTQGTKLFGAKKDDPNETGPEYPRAQFRKYTIDYSWNHYFNIGLRYSSNGKLQLSENTLYSEEQIGVGDRYTVRGFNKGFFLGDNGFYIRNELSLPFYYKGKNIILRNIWSPELFVGLDFGYAAKKGGSALYGTESAAALSGFAFGFRNNAKYFNLGIVAGIPITQPKFIKEIEDNNMELYVNFAVKVF